MLSLRLFNFQPIWKRSVENSSTRTIRFDTMLRNCLSKKGTCFVTISLVYIIALMLNNLTSSNSVHFNSELDLSYGIIIDAGSTGSRLFLYEWSSRSNEELVDIRAVNDDEGKPVVKKATPGLSTFADKPEAATEYLMPLLRYASKYIPVKKLAKTPLFIFATAGMRLLPAEKQDSIIQNLQQKLPTLVELSILPENIKVIAGKWEGIYSWIAVNYMLGRFNSSAPMEKSSERFVSRPKTAGMIDMGGASVQIAFEIPLDKRQRREFDVLKKEEEKGNDNSIELVELLGSENGEGKRRFLYKLFVTTFLGFGVNEGAKRYEKFLWEKFTNNRSDFNKPIVTPISDGCLPVDFLKLTSIEEEDRQLVRRGDGKWDNCVRDISALIFENYKNCAITKSCFFGGIQMPKGISLSDVELYGFSEYWFSVDDVLSLGGVYDHDEFELKARKFCQQTWREVKQKFRAKLYPKADRDRLESQCFKSAWIHAILHNGFYVDEQQNHFQSAFRIKEQEVQWALGAMIYQMRYFPSSATENNYLANGQQNPYSFKFTTFGWTFLIVLAAFAALLAFWKLFRSKRGKNQMNGCGATKSSYRYKKLESRQLFRTAEA